MKALLQKKVCSSSNARLWNEESVQDQELARFDLLTAQFKAMEKEVEEGWRDQKDLEFLKVELEKV